MSNNAAIWYDTQTNQMDITKDRSDKLDDNNKSKYVLHKSTHALAEHNLNQDKLGIINIFTPIKDRFIYKYLNLC